MIWFIRFGRFWCDFVVDDDRLFAVGVAASVATTVLIAHAGGTGLWLMPVAVICTLAISLRRVAKVAAPAAAGRSSLTRPGAK